MKEKLKGFRVASGVSRGIPAAVLIAFCAAAFLGLLLKMVAGEGVEGAGIVIIADMTRVSGVTAWFMNLYNDSRLYFTVITVLGIAIVGIVLGLIMEMFRGGDLLSADRRHDSRRTGGN